MQTGPGDPVVAREMRAHGLAARRAVQGVERTRAQAAIVGHLSAIHAITAPGIAAPQPGPVGVFLADDGEPDLAGFIDVARDRGLGLALPVPEATGNAMTFRRWMAADHLESGRFDISVPPPRPPVVPAAFLVPLVCFDSAGNRIGRGAGFYDRYLAENHSGPDRGALTIGVAFEAQRVATITPTDHDIGLDVIVSELGIRSIWPKGPT